MSVAKFRSATGEGVEKTVEVVHRQYGGVEELLVACGGFKSSVDREVATQFFRVRLWDQDALIGQLLEHYEKLDEDLRAEQPLKRVWMLASQEEADDDE